jgi:hypothetical protein
LAIAFAIANGVTPAAGSMRRSSIVVAYDMSESRSFRSELRAPRNVTMITPEMADDAALAQRRRDLGRAQRTRRASHSSPSTSDVALRTFLIISSPRRRRSHCPASPADVDLHTPGHVHGRSSAGWHHGRM